MERSVDISEDRPAFNSDYVTHSHLQSNAMQFQSHPKRNIAV